MPPLALVTLAALLLNANSAAPRLPEAIEAYQQFDDARAEAAFKAILANAPTSEIAAKAHLYLGLIALNAIHPDLARAELAKAIEANPAIELPEFSSPKAEIAFAEARRMVMRAMAQPDALPPPTGPTRSHKALPPADDVAASSSVATAPPMGVENASPPRSHVLSLGLAGAALVLGVVAVVGGVQVLEYNSLIATANGSHGAIAGHQIASANGAANFWRYGWVGFALGGAATATVSLLTW